ncbi:unnamed protein product [Rhizophagus irregularis]|nr:unnamed protein product [Rhizophagus irregularis]
MTEEARRTHVSQFHVRWSEIYRLHYFNPVRFCVVDPMHCLFLGVAKWIVTKLWIGEGILNDEKLKIMQKRADAIKITSDLGRRPVRIATGEGFSNFTADMWRIFIMIFAIPITWDFLDEIDRRILAYFVRACKILTSRELQKNELNEAFVKLIEMNKLVEQKYGQEKISPNLHLCLHICECSLDYGPISSFWCFGFERMNGILGSYNNSRRNIEPELLRIMNENSFLKYFLSNCDNDVQCSYMDIIKSKKSVGSLSAHDEFESDNYLNFIGFSCIKDESAIGTESFPEELMNPYHETILPDDILNLLVNFYKNLYDDHFISISSMIGPSNDIVLDMRNRHILAQFVQDDGTIDTYPGQVQFFFEHTIYKSQAAVHSLALVRWYKPVRDHKIRYYCQVDEEDIKSCNIELWSNEFYGMSRDSIIPIHNILGKFIKSKFYIGKKQQKEYMAVIALNKKISF